MKAKTINVIVYLGTDERGRAKRDLLMAEAKRSPFQTFSAFILDLIRRGATPALGMALDYLDEHAAVAQRGRPVTKGGKRGK